MTLGDLLDLVRARRAQHQANLDGWREPGGFLLPTEPDPDERRLVRERLKAAIYEDDRIIEFIAGKGGG